MNKIYCHTVRVSHTCLIYFSPDPIKTHNCMSICLRRNSNNLESSECYTKETEHYCTSTESGILTVNAGHFPYGFSIKRPGHKSYLLLMN